MPGTNTWAGTIGACIRSDTVTDESVTAVILDDTRVAKFTRLDAFAGTSDADFFVPTLTAVVACTTLAKGTALSRRTVVCTVTSIWICLAALVDANFRTAAVVVA